MVQLPAGGHVGALPAHALLELAVAADAVDVIVLPLGPARQSHAGGDGDAVAQRAGGHVHAHSAVHRGVALEGAAQLAQIEVLHLGLEVAPLVEGGIVDGTGVALGDDEPIAVFPVRLGGIQAHLLEEEDRHDIGDGERGPGMPVLPLIDHADSLTAEGLCGLLQHYSIQRNDLLIHISSNVERLTSMGG